MVKSEREVQMFLDEIGKRLRESYENLKIVGRTQSKDKTFEFRARYNISHSMVCEEILKLDVTNYSYTEEDRDISKKGEVWIFGQIFLGDIVPGYPEVYIKLKLNDRVICLSFHPKEFDLRYPYHI